MDTPPTTHKEDKKMDVITIDGTARVMLNKDQFDSALLGVATVIVTLDGYADTDQVPFTFIDAHADDMAWMADELRGFLELAGVDLAMHQIDYPNRDDGAR